MHQVAQETHLLNIPPPNNMAPVEISDKRYFWQLCPVERIFSSVAEKEGSRLNLIPIRSDPVQSKFHHTNISNYPWNIHSPKTVCLLHCDTCDKGLRLTAQKHLWHVVLSLSSHIGGVNPLYSSQFSVHLPSKGRKFRHSCWRGGWSWFLLGRELYLVSVYWGAILKTKN